MKLLDDKYFPITTEIGFFEASLEKISNEFEKWQNEIVSKISKNTSVLSKSMNLPFEKSLKELLPLNNIETRKFLLVETQSEWTAFFTNRFPYPDVVSATGFLPKRLKSKSIRVVSVQNEYDKKINKGVLGGYILSLFGYQEVEYNNCIRSISLINEGNQWDFEEYGNPLSFENTELYKQRVKEKRFNSEIIDSYLKNFNIDFYNPGFYRNNSVLITKSGEIFNGMKFYDLEEAQKKLKQ